MRAALSLPRTWVSRSRPHCADTNLRIGIAQVADDVLEFGRLLSDRETAAVTKTAGTRAINRQIWAWTLFGGPRTVTEPTGDEAQKTAGATTSAHKCSRHTGSGFRVRCLAFRSEIFEPNALNRFSFAIRVTHPSRKTSGGSSSPNRSTMSSSTRTICRSAVKSSCNSPREREDRFDALELRRARASTS